MKDTFEKRYYKEIDKKFNNIHKIGLNEYDIFKS